VAESTDAIKLLLLPLVNNSDAARPMPLTGGRVMMTDLPSRRPMSFSLFASFGVFGVCRPAPPI